MLQADGLVFGLGFVLLAWFFGGYSFLRWPWMPFWRLVQRWLLVLGIALALAMLVGWLLNAPITAVWFHHSTLMILGLVLGFWGGLMRRWLHPLAQRQAAMALARSPLSRTDRPSAQVAPTAQRQLLLLLVAYHPSLMEVKQLQACLAELPPEVGYAVVVNDHQPGEPVEHLEPGADCFLTNHDNPGYGRAVNQAGGAAGKVAALHRGAQHRSFLGPGSLERMLAWLQQHPTVNLAVPQILDEQGALKSCASTTPRCWDCSADASCPMHSSPVG